MSWRLVTAVLCLAEKGQEEFQEKHKNFWLRGMSLVRHKIEQLIKANVFSEIVVSTDDEMVMEIVNEFSNTMFVNREIPNLLGVQLNLSIWSNTPVMFVRMNGYYGRM